MAKHDGGASSVHVVFDHFTLQSEPDTAYLVQNTGAEVYWRS